MKKWNLIIDVALCHDCNDCFLADKDEFVGNDFPPYSAAQPWTGHRWMNIERKERGQYPLVQVAFLPMPCMHCDDAPCVTEDGAVFKREDGLVLIDPVKAKGRPEIVDSCPYGAIYWNEELALAQKCTGCAHLVDEGWTETRCSQVCPTGAIKLVLADDDHLAALAEAEGLKAFKAELGTEPRVLYKNLHRWEKVFIAGSVVEGDSDECAENAQVTVRVGKELGARVAVDEAFPLDGEIVGRGVTNNYGDFVVDGLESDRSYIVSVEKPGYLPRRLSLTLETSTTVRDIRLEKAHGRR